MVAQYFIKRIQKKTSTTDDSQISEICNRKDLLPEQDIIVDLKINLFKIPEKVEKRSKSKSYKVIQGEQDQ